MKVVYKIYQSNFESTHEHDFFLKLDDKEYLSVKDAEFALEAFLNSTNDTGEYMILPLYIRE